MAALGLSLCFHLDCLDKCGYCGARVYNVSLKYNQKCKVAAFFHNEEETLVSQTLINENFNNVKVKCKNSDIKNILFLALAFYL